jgi:hypothetical protein
VLFAILSTGQGEHQTVRQRAFLCSRLTACACVRQKASGAAPARTSRSHCPFAQVRPINGIFQRVCLQRQFDRGEMAHLYKAIVEGRADTLFMIEVFQTLSTGNASLLPRFEAFLRAWLVCHLDDPHFLGGGKNSTNNAGNQQHTLVHLYNNVCRADA